MPFAELKNTDIDPSMFAHELTQLRDALNAPHLFEMHMQHGLYGIQLWRPLGSGLDLMSDYRAFKDDAERQRALKVAAWLRDYLNIEENLKALATLHPMTLHLRWHKTEDGEISIEILNPDSAWVINPEKAGPEEHHLWHQA